MNLRNSRMKVTGVERNADVMQRMFAFLILLCADASTLGSAQTSSPIYRDNLCQLSILGYGDECAGTFDLSGSQYVRQVTPPSSTISSSSLLPGVNVLGQRTSIAGQPRSQSYTLVADTIRIASPRFRPPSPMRNSPLGSQSTRRRRKRRN